MTLTHDSVRIALLDRTRAPLTGALAVLGGAAWTAAAVLHARQPAGCVGDGCGLRPMREATTATSVLMALAALALLASGAGLLAAVRRGGALRRTGRAGAALVVAGVAVLAAAVASQELLGDGDAPWMPYLVVPGVCALAAGTVLVGWNVLRSPVVPRWAGGGVILGALLLVLANEQTAAVLLAVPFGLAWVALGVVLLRRG